MIKLNGKPVIPTVFPDKTTQVWGLNNSALYEDSESVISWFYESDSELIQIAQLKDLLDKHDCNVSLYIDYLPYARQDKPISNESTFALHSFAKLLNALEFDDIQILDPHSNEAIKLIRNSTTTYPTFQVVDALARTEAGLICYPDKGALQKYANRYGYKHVYADKVRDQLTGKILSIELQGDVQGKNILILDDLCDAGGTFIGLAEVLYAKGANEVNLFVTHGLFSKGTDVLFNSGIKRIFTANGEVSRSNT